MSGFVRKILIYAIADGVVMQPLPLKNGQGQSAPIKILYKDNSIESVIGYEYNRTFSNKCFEAFGIVGLLTVSNTSFLISIIKREQVAQIHGKPIYVVTEVALTPVTCLAEAEASIGNTQNQLLKNIETDHHAYSIDSEEHEEESDNICPTVSPEADEEMDQEKCRNLPTRRRKSSVAEDVMAKRGGYGRIAQKWFSRTGWALDQRRNMGMTSPEDLKTTADDCVDSSTSGLLREGKQNQSLDNERQGNEYKVGFVTEKIFQKLIRRTELLLGSSKSFYFSYEWDITRVYSQPSILKNESPLSREALANFFWNNHLLKPFINAGQTSFSLPLMQGFIGQREFKLSIDPQECKMVDHDGAGLELTELSQFPINYEQSMEENQDISHDPTSSNEVLNTSKTHEKNFILTIISRRSIRRAGLRYLRRGVDENGFTANFVETEQILSDPNWDPSRRLSSFIQIRGSIPVFWSQSPNSFKPIPRLQHSEETNLRGYHAHIKKLTSTYGDVQVISLVEKQEPEAIVGMEFEKLVKTLNEAVSNKNDGAKGIGFEWWDFHANCRGMKFENVNMLVDLLKEKIDAFGYTTLLQGSLESRQVGVFRTNCMDCLDRTNVTQSAFARKVLELQLKKEGIELAFQANQETEWFNSLWADNGDAISKQYTSTAALKGDFTRTKKRELTGALKDVSLSISRFCSGIFNDYFSQTAIDYLLGNVTERIFEDFDEKFMTVDLAISMQRLRQQIIDLCQRQVIVDKNEEFVSGWTLLTPMLPNTIISNTLQESVLVITDAALYSCLVDWNLEKLLSFERIELRNIESIKYGTYITSTLSTAQVDEERNIGFVITYIVANNKDGIVSDSSSKETQPDENNFSEKSSTNALLNKFTKVVVGRAAVTARASTISVGESSNTPRSKPELRVLALKALPSRSSIADGEELRLNEIEQVNVICSEIERLVNSIRIPKFGSESVSLVEHTDIISLSEARKSTSVIEKLSYNFKKLVWG
ncbi:Phosphatidylinositide phosphatase SAC2 [Golovinomyces cichoracearum]|uniref:Phosphatidylinositide phosphatase SAC2 n=1 Tax=Golovinomyces cichoracearum TaxID=62708 RepID=A0A420IXK2_9PEZI|nr:Phosphatidylinositide phosphatase SAC2 [Golovinomyces cichoracearum]